MRSVTEGPRREYVACGYAPSTTSWFPSPPLQRGRILVHQTKKTEA
jgi:hypothetical protein